MTMPSLIANHKEREYVTSLKKTYSVLDNAYHSIIFENGTAADWDLLPIDYAKDENGQIIKDSQGNPYDKNVHANANNMFEKFRPYLLIIKECKRGETGCFPEKAIHPLSGGDINLVTAQSEARKFIVLADGTSIGFLQNRAIYVDVNGLKKPNKIGADIFQFEAGKNSLEFYDDRTAEVKCYTNEWTCSAWVIANDNEDYLHCDDLSWNGKSKCK